MLALRLVWSIEVSSCLLFVLTVTALLPQVSSLVLLSDTIGNCKPGLFVDGERIRFLVLQTWIYARLKTKASQFEEARPSTGCSVHQLSTTLEIMIESLRIDRERALESHFTTSVLPYIHMHVTPHFHSSHTCHGQSIASARNRIV